MRFAQSSRAVTIGSGTNPEGTDNMIRLIAILITAALLAASPADDRTADREAIRAHIDRIFQAFIHKDSADLRATHEQNWLGYLEGSGTMIRGVDGYMEATGNFTPGSAYGMKSYKMREFDMIFKGDAAFVCFVADVESNTPNGVVKRALRITDFYTKKDGQWIQTGSDTDLHPESVAEQYQTLRTLPDQARKQLLDAREAVWRAYFAGDRATLEKLIPEETVTIEAGGNPVRESKRGSGGLRPIRQERRKACAFGVSED